MKAILFLVFKITLVAIGTYAAFVLYLYFMQNKMLYPASRQVWRTPSDWSWQYESVRLEVENYTTIGWYIPLENARAVVLFSHGNAGNIADRLESIELLRSFGLSVLVYDYGGYGDSTGSPSEKRTYADIRAMWDYLIQEQGYSEDKIILFGRSLGGAVTMQLAPDVHAGAVILESTFKSIPHIVHDYWPFVPAKLLAKNQYPSIDEIPNVNSPLLIIHSPDDEIIPYQHGIDLYEAASQPKTFATISGNHNYGFVDSGESYRKIWDDFLTSIFGKFN